MDTKETIKSEPEILSKLYQAMNLIWKELKRPSDSLLDLRKIKVLFLIIILIH